MSNHRAALAFLLMALSLSCACTLLLHWDEEGLPCDSAGRCTVNHTCIAGRCVMVDGGSSCGSRICPVGYSCDADAGVGCSPLISPALGHICNDDSNCLASGTNRVCLKGAVQSPTSGGVPRTGICVELCGAGDRCMTGNTKCTSFSLGLDAGSAKLCITPRLLVPCVNDDACREQGLVCTLYDHPQLGPISVCDQPLAEGAQVGGPCVLNTQTSGGGQLCGNGLCVPRVPEGAAAARCGELCDRSTCTGGATCRLAEISVSVPGTIRQVPMCQLGTGICKDCSLNPAICGADAPRCTTYGATKRCLPSCTPDAGTSTVPACPPGYRCEVLGGIGARCTPTSGACP